MRRSSGIDSARPVVHLLHIGKTGGTAVQHALADHLVTPSYSIVLHPHNYRLSDVPAGDKVVFFVRDPVSRFVSGFYSRQRKGRPRYHFPWSKGERAAFERFATAQQLGDALTAGDKAVRAGAINAMQNIAHVNTSYWDWFRDEDYFRTRVADLLMLGSQETLAADFEILKAKLALPDHVSLPRDDVAAHRQPLRSHTELSGEARANIKQWYARDYTFVKLCRAIGFDRVPAYDFQALSEEHE